MGQSDVRRDPTAVARRLPSRFDPRSSFFLLMLSVAMYGMSLWVLIEKGQRQSFVEGDLGVWNEVLYLVSGGASLYEDVWDHKDPGYFGLTLPVKALFPGDWHMVFQIAVSLATALALHKLLRQLHPTSRFALFFSSALTLALVTDSRMYPSYFESIAICLILWTIWGFANSSFVVGLALTLLCTIKVSFLALLPPLGVAALGFSYRSNRWPTTRQKFHIVSGIALGLAPSLAVLQLSNLHLWAEVAEFNSFYAQYRSAAPDFRIAAFIAILAVSCIPLIAKLRKFQQTAEAPSVLPELLIFSGTATFGVSILQFPLAYQHQHLVTGSLVMIILGFSGKSSISLKTAMAAGATLILAISPVGIWRSVSEDSNYLRPSLETNVKVGDLSFLKSSSEGTYVLWLGASRRLDQGLLEDLPGVRVCRFIYFYPHLQAFFRDELSACVREADVVIVDDVYERDSWLQFTGLFEIDEFTQVHPSPSGEFITFRKSQS